MATLRRQYWRRDYQKGTVDKSILRAMPRVMATSTGLNVAMHYLIKL